MASGRFDLIEEMRFEPHEGTAELEEHLARMRESAEALGFQFDRHAARNELQAATFRLRSPSLIRLMLSPTGSIAIETRPFPSVPAQPVVVALLDHPLAADDPRRLHRTSDRTMSEARTETRAYEALFVDADGFLTAGCAMHVFVRNGHLLTPPRTRGFPSGILRDRLIAEGGAVERDLRPEDLGSEFLIGNSLCGLLRAVRQRAESEAAGQ